MMEAANLEPVSIRCVYALLYPRLAIEINATRCLALR